MTQLTTTKANLTPALKRAAAVAAGHSTLPILSNLRLISRGETLEITGTDLETEITTHCGALGDEFEITIPARKMVSIVNGLADDAAITLTIRADDARATLVSGRSRYHLATLPAADFPTIETGQAEPISLPCAPLGRLIAGTLHAAAAQDVRFYLNGVLLEGDQNTLTGVATDGHRLAMRRCTEIQTAGTALQGQRIIPIAAAKLIARLLTDGDTAQVRAWDGGIQAAVGAQRLTSKLIDGRYPDWPRVVPRQVEQRATVDRLELLGAITRVGILSNEEFRGIRLEFDPAGEIRLSARNLVQEEATETIQAACTAECATAFNLSYLSQALQSIGTERAVIRYSGQQESVMVLDESADESTAVDVVMPMRL